MKPAKIKICGLTRLMDAESVNLAMPDYAGFVFSDISRRYVTPDQARSLRAAIRPAIKTVGVFVNAPAQKIIELIKERIIDVIQLHGDEDHETIAKLRELHSGAEIWKAFKIQSEKDIEAALCSEADMVLLDSGSGSGRRFDWSVISGFPRPFILAGGLTPENIREAVGLFHPYAVDISSGVETDGCKDSEKIIAAVNAARRS